MMDVKSLRAEIEEIISSHQVRSPSCEKMYVFGDVFLEDDIKPLAIALEQLFLSKLSIQLARQGGKTTQERKRFKKEIKDLRGALYHGV
jgi:hypothetical protein